MSMGRSRVLPFIVNHFRQRCVSAEQKLRSSSGVSAYMNLHRLSSAYGVLVTCLFPDLLPLTADRRCADISSILHTLESDVLRRLVCASCRSREVCASR